MTLKKAAQPGRLFCLPRTGKWPGDFYASQRSGSSSAWGRRTGNWDQIAKPVTVIPDANRIGSVSVRLWTI